MELKLFIFSKKYDSIEKSVLTGFKKGILNEVIKTARTPRYSDMC